MTRLRQVLGPAVVLVALVALALTLRSQGDDARTALQRTDARYVALSFLAVVLGLVASAQVWRCLLAGLGHRLGPSQAAHVFFVGQLGKYVPGTVFAAAAQAQVATRYAVPRTRAATSWVLFMVVLMGTGLLSAAATLPLSSPEVFERYGVVLLALPVVLALLTPPVLNRLLAALFARTRRAPLEAPLRWSTMAQAVGWSLLMWAAHGAHLALLVAPQEPDGGHRLPLLAVGAFALAWAAGPFLVIAPAGAGVREAVLVLALAPVLPVAAATAVAVVSRLLMAAGDGLLALASWLVGRGAGGRVGTVKQSGKAADA